MGAAQSRPAEPEVREQLLERLRALDLKMQRQLEISNGSEKEYLFVDKSARNIRGAPPAYEKLSQDVSVAAVGQWEKELMEDPKVCTASVRQN